MRSLPAPKKHSSVEIDKDSHDDKTYIVSRLVKFPMLGERMPERFWLGASLPNGNGKRNGKTQRKHY